MVPEDYVHRIGRTGASGQAISLVSTDEEEYVRGIEKLLGMRLEGADIECFEPTQGPVEGGNKRVQDQVKRNIDIQNYHLQNLHQLSYFEE